jgi:hypothetical protein
MLKVKFIKPVWPKVKDKSFIGAMYVCTYLSFKIIRIQVNSQTNWYVFWSKYVQNLTFKIYPKLFWPKWNFIKLIPSGWRLCRGPARLERRSTGGGGIAVDRVAVHSIADQSFGRSGCGTRDATRDLSKKQVVLICHRGFESRQYFSWVYVWYVWISSTRIFENSKILENLRGKWFCFL